MLRGESAEAGQPNTHLDVEVVGQGETWEVGGVSAWELGLFMRISSTLVTFY